MLGWYELPEKDQPPRYIWLDDEALEAHFNEVKAKWESGGGGNQNDDEPELLQNEATRGLKERLRRG